MPVSQKVQIDTFDFGPSLTAPTLGVLATGTTIANGTANTCNEQTADSGVYVADFVGADASALIPAGTYRLRTTVNGLPLKRFVTFAGVDGEVVYARSEEHAVLDAAYLFDDGAGRLAINANVTHYQGTLQGNGDLPAKMDAIKSDTNTLIGRITTTVVTLWANLTAMITGTGGSAKFTTVALSNAPTGSGRGGDNAEVIEAIDAMKSLISEWIALNIPSDVRGFPATIIGGTDIEVSIEVVDSNNDPITEIFGESVETVQWLFGMGTSARRARILGSVEWTSDDLLMISMAKADTLSEDDGPRTWMIGCKLTSGEVKWVKTGVTRLIGRQFAEPTTTTTGA